MLQTRFLRSRASEGKFRLGSPIYLVAECGDHLEDRVGESELENPSGDRPVHRGGSEVLASPGLSLAGNIRHRFKCPWMFRVEPSRKLGPFHREIPRIHFTGGDPLYPDGHRKTGGLGGRFAEEGRIVPGFARDGFALRIGTARHDVRQNGADIVREPAEPKGDVQNMQPEVPQAEKKGSSFR